MRWRVRFRIMEALVFAALATLCTACFAAWKYDRPGLIVVGFGAGFVLFLLAAILRESAWADCLQDFRGRPARDRYRVVVAHAWCPCECPCCGHRVSVYLGDELVAEKFLFDHPDSQAPETLEALAEGLVRGSNLVDANSKLEYDWSRARIVSYNDDNH